MRFHCSSQSGQKVAGAIDATGAARAGPQSRVLLARFRTKFTYTGAKSLQSGLPGEKAKPMTVKSPKVVTVAKKGAKIPTAKQDAAAGSKQADAALKAAEGLETTNPGANTVDPGVAAKGGVE